MTTLNYLNKYICIYEIGFPNKVNDHISLTQYHRVSYSGVLGITRIACNAQLIRQRLGVGIPFLLFSKKMFTINNILDIHDVDCVCSFGIACHILGVE